MKYKILFMILIVVQLPACYGRNFSRQASEIVKRMSTEEKIGQMILCALPGKKLNADSEKIIKEIRPGGLIFFGYNISTAEETSVFIDELQKTSEKAGGLPLFISVDQEGGRVIRIVDGATQFPGAMAAGVCNREDYVEQSARILGLELVSLGFNMNFAPVLDVNNNPANPVINTRSFGPEPEKVSRMGMAYIRGLQRSGCIAVCKHFPGHGDTGSDSHITLPVIVSGMDRLESVEWIPFRKAIEADVAGVMTAHIAFPNLLGNNEPATISPFFLTGILRDRMNFNGLVITDDMEMKGVASGREPGEAAVLAVRAGADIVLTSSWEHVNRMFMAISDAVKRGDLSPERIDSAVRRIVECKLKYNIMALTNKGIVSGESRFTPEDKNLLLMAGEVNRALSEGGLAWSGNDTLLSSPDDIRIVVSGSTVIRESYRRDANHFYFFDLAQALDAEYPSEKRRIIFFHMHKADDNAVRTLIDTCSTKNIIPVILCTGNPFPLYGIKGLAGILATFSSTDESLRAAAYCISGRIAPHKMKDFFPAAIQSQ